jgi:hypothetical protein
MSNLVGPNNRPIETERPANQEEASPGNGEGEINPLLQIQLMPTGLLQLNLTTFICKANDLENMIGSMKMQMQMQKMVGEPPQMAAMVEELQKVTLHRFVFCKELNDRARAADEAYWTAQGFPPEMWPAPETLPASPEEEAPEEPGDAEG